ncbi:MAG: hypothetical protein IPP07_21140 [Holophagales bacterium]|nr:hypothetical protein [Holophagales bacterium]
MKRAEPGRPTWRLIWLTLVLSPLFLPVSSAALSPERPLTQAQVDVWQVENGLPQNTVTSILRTRDGHLWFGTYDGLVRFDGARFTVFDGRTTPLLATGSAFALMEDRRGTLWIGRSENVVQYRGGVFRQVLGDELGQGTIWSLSEAPDGTVWAGAGKGLVRWKDGKATLLTKRDGLPAGRLRSTCLDKDGTLWIGTSGAGLVAMREGRVTTFSTETGFPSDQIITVLPDPAGGVWVATAGAGLVRIVGDSRRVYGRGGWTADGPAHGSCIGCGGFALHRHVGKRDLPPARRRLLLPRVASSLERQDLVDPAGWGGLHLGRHVGRGPEPAA